MLSEHHSRQGLVLTYDRAIGGLTMTDIRNVSSQGHPIHLPQTSLGKVGLPTWTLEARRALEAVREHSAIGV